MENLSRRNFLGSAAMAAGAAGLASGASPATHSHRPSSQPVRNDPIQVEIEFSGLCIAAHQAGAGQMRVLFPQPRNLGGPTHAPVLLVPDSAGLQGIPHFTVTTPSSSFSDAVEGEVEFAGWYLRGEVRIAVAPDDQAAVQFVQPNRDPVPVVDEARQNWKSVRYLLNLGEMVGATRLVDSAFAPVAASFLLDVGEFRPRGLKGAEKAKVDVWYGDPEQKLYSEPRRRAERGVLRLPAVARPFQISFDSPLGGREIVGIDPSRHLGTLAIVCSNLTSGTRPGHGHLDAYAQCVNATRRVTRISRVTAEVGDPPLRPEECFVNWMDLS